MVTVKNTLYRGFRNSKTTPAIKNVNDFINYISITSRMKFRLMFSLVSGGTDHEGDTIASQAVSQELGQLGVPVGDVAVPLAGV